MSLLRRVRERLAGEAGFTIVELMTAMVIGLIVTFAAFALLDRSFTASSQVADRVDASQRGRLAMDRITRQLRSQVCVGTTLPLLDATTTSATFTTDFGDGTNALSPKKHVLTFAAAANGYSVTERTYAMTAGPPAQTTATWATTPKTTTVLTGAAQAKASDGTTLPFLQYFGWDATKTYREFTPPIAAADLARVSQIVVSYAVNPAKASSGADRRTTLTDRIALPQADPNQTDPKKDAVIARC